jgi:hypothetical protein
MDTFLLVSGLASIAAANLFVWWMWGRYRMAALRSARAHVTRLQLANAHLVVEVERLRYARAEAES